MFGDQQHFTTAELADQLRLKPQTLRLWRLRGYGPPYVKVSSRCVLYRSDDVDGWLSERTFQSTAAEEQDIRQVGRTG